MTREDAVKGLRDVADWHYGKYEQTHEEDYLSDGDFLTAVANMLKAQEPRVMLLEDVLELKYDDVVFLEVFPTKSVLSAIVIDVVSKLPEIDIGVVQLRFAPTWNGINNADLTYYGKTWRCWTSRPTDEQREKVKWE